MLGEDAAFKKVLHLSRADGTTTNHKEQAEELLANSSLARRTILMMRETDHKERQ
jgi:hypothetical protein